jgi:hypothetical protein
MNEHKYTLNSSATRMKSSSSTLYTSGIGVCGVLIMTGDALPLGVIIGYLT